MFFRDNFERQLIDEMPSLRRYARALCGDREKGDDLVQDTLERALRKREYWLKEKPLRPWLFTIMHNIYVSQVRKNIISVVPKIEHESVDDVQDTYELNAQIRELDQALIELHENHRQTFLLVSLEGFTYKEVAEITQVPVGTVMSRLSRARASLRKYLLGSV